ncbi:hypothetical protein F4775DRAFT_597977 [Biscogniauxia sp. FL1348]|nr:hypothetical protein F4775DRAFT_597977 [Biscogniauxia sp. FL1348]
MSSEHLLGIEDASSIDELPGYDGLRVKPKDRKPTKICILHIILLTLNILLLVILIRKTLFDEDQVSLHAQSPAKEVVRYQSTYFKKYGHLDSPFSQKPGPELDAAWHEQLSGMNIRVSSEWLKPFNAESVHLANGSGVLVQLGVYHELHCLKKLKHWIYRSHYYGNISATDLEEEEAHIEHCLEWLRVAVLCRGDTTLTTFRWGGRGGSSLETEYPIPRQCVDSDRLLEWSERHSVDITQQGLLETKP